MKFNAKENQHDKKNLNNINLIIQKNTNNNYQIQLKQQNNKEVLHKKDVNMHNNNMNMKNKCIITDKNQIVNIITQYKI